MKTCWRSPLLVPDIPTEMVDVDFKEYMNALEELSEEEDMARLVAEASAHANLSANVTKGAPNPICNYEDEDPADSKDESDDVGTLESQDLLPAPIPPIYDIDGDEPSDEAPRQEMLRAETMPWAWLKLKIWT